MIGKFEEFCLLALIRSGPDALASKVYETLCDHLGKEFKFGAVYTTLDRMVEKKWIKVSEQKPEGGGRTRRYFTISGEGRVALGNSLQSTQRLSIGLYPELGHCRVEG